MWLRRYGVLVSLTLLVVALAACGGGAGASSPSGAVNAAPAPKDAQVLNVSSKDIAFVETTLSAQAGKPIAVNFKNTGALEHSIIFDLPPAGDKGGDAGLPKDWTSSMRGLGSGKSDRLDLPALEAGTYKYYCHIPGHETMVGTLTVK